MLKGIDIDRNMPVVTRRSSRSRNWTGFEAAIAGVPGGITEVAGFLNHNVSMLIGAPIATSCSCDGVMSHRFQVPGEFDLIPAGYGGAWVDHAPTTLLLLRVSPMLMRSAAEAMGINADLVNVAPRLRATDPLVEHIGWAVKAELESNVGFDRLYGESLGLALASHFLRAYSSIVPKRVTRGLSSRALRRVTDYIDDNLAHDLSLAEVADVAGMSASHFKMLFKASLGLPVHQYVIRRRVEYAMQLVVAGRLPLSDIALQAGFANQSHLARCMRRVAGVTPGAVRAR